jgi:acyl transferase domain-containing protein
MDPQFRLQLESAFEALESGMSIMISNVSADADSLFTVAGISIKKIAQTNTSVFAGAFCGDYYGSFIRDPETVPRYFMTGNGGANDLQSHLLIF